MARLTLWGIYQYDKTLFDGIVLPDGIDKDNLVSDIMRNSGDLYPYHQVPEYLKRNINFWFARRLFDFERMYEALRTDYSPIENYDRIEDIKREYKDSGTDTETLTLGSSTTSKHTGSDTETLTLGSSTTSKHTGSDTETTALGSSTTSKHTGSDTETTTLGSSTTSAHTGTDTNSTQGSGTNEKGVSAYNEDGYTNREKDTETHNSNNMQTFNSTVTNTGSGSDTKTQTFDSTVTNTGSGSDTQKQTFDSSVTNSGSGSDKTQTDYGKQRTETENTRIHGNIGVTTSQQMIESEMSLRAKYDIYKIISREFEREFLVQIY